MGDLRIRIHNKAISKLDQQVLGRQFWAGAVNDGKYEC
jgi:hypothetical protein